ncbi:MAG: adenylate/guanylate cyclase domain-containing protein [Gammaproteobacteria bacterium]|jgi:adenylate cyclase
MNALSAFFRRTVSIRWSIMRNLFLLLFLICGTIFAVSYLSYKKAVDELSVQVVERFNEKTHAHLESFFEPVRKTVLTARAWGAGGRLRMDEMDDLNALFMPLLREFGQITSVNIGSSDGSDWLLLQQPDGWMNRVVRADAWGGEARLYHRQADGGLRKQEKRAIGYDPRQQPWFIGASAMQGEAPLFWTRPYSFFTTGEPGMTVASRWRDAGSGTTFVIAFDIKLIDITAFTTSLDVSPNGKAAILTQDGKVLGLPRDPAFGSREQQTQAVMKSLEELQIALLDRIYAHRGMPDQGQHVFHFSSDGRKWWGGIDTYPLGDAQRLLIGIMVPEGDFLGHLRQQSMFIVLIFLAAILMAMLMSFVLASKYSKPLEALAQRSRRLRELDLETGETIESRVKEVMRLVRAHEEMTSGLQSFSRYVPVELVKQLLLQGEVARIGGEIRELSILFTDIRDFTTISEKMPPERLTAHLAGYFDIMLRQLNEMGATVDKFIGDAIVAFWGAPQEDAAHIEHSLEAVLGCISALESFNAECDAQGLPRLETCFGLGAGRVVVGNVGSQSRLSYTALGDTVNLVSRLEGLNRFYGTQAIVMERVVIEAGERYLFRRLDEVRVKGRQESVVIYELLGRQGEVSAARLAFREDYERALDCYRRRDFHAAVETLEMLAQTSPGDLSVSRLLDDCRRYVAEAPPADWDGISRFDVK